MPAAPVHQSRLANRASLSRGSLSRGSLSQGRDSRDRDSQGRRDRDRLPANRRTLLRPAASARTKGARGRISCAHPRARMVPAASRVRVSLVWGNRAVRLDPTEDNSRGALAAPARTGPGSPNLR